MLDMLLNYNYVINASYNPLTAGHDYTRIFSVLLEH